MVAAIGVVVGLVIGFIVGWLVRDARSRPLQSVDEVGIGVPAEWHRRHSGREGD